MEREPCRGREEGCNDQTPDQQPALGCGGKAGAESRGLMLKSGRGTTMGLQGFLPCLENVGLVCTHMFLRECIQVTRNYLNYFFLKIVFIYF